MPDETSQAPLRVFGWAQDRSGCGNYRIGLPMWALAQQGHDARAFDVLNCGVDDVDVLVGQLMYDEHRAEQFLEIAARPGRRPVLVFEIDDDIWNIHSSNTAALVVRSPEIRGRVEACLRAADAVTVTTQPLAEIVGRFNPNVHVLPNCIDLNVITAQRPVTPGLTVGWAGGSSHLNDFASVRSSLRQFLRRHPEIEMNFVGQDYRDLFKLPNTRHTEWSTDLADYLRSVDFHIGIAPLAYHGFNRSKSDIRVLEYAALGIPVVASDFGPYAESVQHGVTGFLVKRPHEWNTYLQTLVDDERLRLLMGINAKLWASERTIQGNVWRWEAVYRDTIRRVHGDDHVPAMAAAPAAEPSVPDFLQVRPVRETATP